MNDLAKGRIQEIKDYIEDKIDQQDLDTVLGYVSEICFEKAQHLETNWQDTISAKQWKKAGLLIDNCRTRIDKATDGVIGKP